MATITITPGNSFTSTETVTAGKLNDLGSPTAALTAESIQTNDIADEAITLDKLSSGALEKSYPVGSIYMNASDATNPATLLGFGTWVAFGAGRVPVGIDSGDTDFDTAEEIGGSKVPALLAHTHDTPSGMLSGNFAGGAAGYDSGSYYSPINNTSRTTTSASSGDQNNGNLQPYIVVYMWKRTV